jgi:hypothetical protein
MRKQAAANKRQLSVQFRNGHKPLTIAADTFNCHDGFVEFKSGNHPVALLNAHDVVSVVETGGK